MRVLTIDEFQAQLDAERATPPRPTQEMVEAVWAVLNADGIAPPPVATMEAMWAAMERAR